MNIQGANLLSQLSGSEGLPGLVAGGLETPASSGFAAALMGQLEVLQSGLDTQLQAGHADLSALQDWMGAAGNGTVTADLPSFAALLGTDLPPATAKAASADIDLEDTLQTLAGVLQQLQQLEASGQSGLEATVSELGSPNLDAQALSTAKTTPKTLPTEASEPEAIIDPAAAGVLIMPMTQPQAELNAIMAQTPASLPEIADGIAKKAGINLQANQPNAQPETVSGKQDEFGLDFDRSIGAMLAKQNGDGKPQQPSEELDAKMTDLASQLDGASKASETAKSLPGLAAEVTKLNQAVRGEASPVNTQSTLTKPYTDPAWNKELGEKLIWMHKQSIPSVELRLNPEHLGPVLVKIDVNQDQANVAFTTQHLAVKEAIEAALPKLKEMFSGQQLNLADVNVSQQQSDQRQPAREFFQMASGQQRHGDSAEPDSHGKASQSLVDEIEAGRAVATNGLLSLFA